MAEKMSVPTTSYRRVCTILGAEDDEKGHTTRLVPAQHYV